MNKTPKKTVLRSIDGRARKKPKTRSTRSSKPAIAPSTTPSVSEAAGVSDPQQSGIDVTPTGAARVGCREPFALIFTKQGGRSLSPDDELVDISGQPAFKSC